MSLGSSLDPCGGETLHGKWAEPKNNKIKILEFKAKPAKGSLLNSQKRAKFERHLYCIKSTQIWMEDNNKAVFWKS